MSLMELMIRVMCKLDEMRVPIVFKGAMVLKTAIKQAGINVNTERYTQDIDGDWMAQPPSMNELRRIIELAVKSVDNTLWVETKREYGVGKAAGFNIRDNESKIIFSMDIDVNKPVHPKAYIIDVNKSKFNGASLNKILADKITTSSHRYIYRRVKDVYDLYLLSCIVGYNSYEVWEIIEENKKITLFGQFEEIRNQKEIEHAYNKLSRVVNKPDFNILYPRVLHFIEPFMTDYKARNLVWDGNNWV